MSDIVKRLRDRRLNVWEQAKELADKAAEENRAFSADEQGTWDALNEEIDKLDARIKSAMDTEQRAKDADDAFDKLSGNDKKKNDSERRGGVVDDQGQNVEIRRWLKGQSGSRYFEVRPQGYVSTDIRSTLLKGVPSGGGY